MSAAAGDPNDPTSLQARIRAVEAAVARRDAAFLRELDEVSGEIRQVGRKSAGWLAGAGAVAGVLLLIGALRPHARRREPQVARGGRRHAHDGHHGGWLAAVLPLAMSLLAPGRGMRLPGTAGIVWSLLQQMRGARGSRGARARGLRTVERLDLQRYAGAWFEYARLPMPFQAACSSDVTAHYTPDGHGGLHVLNRCLDETGASRDAHGIARPGEAPGQLEVTFAPAWLRWLPFVWAPYCVLDLDADYRHALVGTPDRRYLWLLSRSTTIEKPTLLRMVEIAEAQGFPVERLERTPHRGH